MSPPRPARDPATRRRAYRLGLAAETLAAWALRLRGYRILDRRFKAAQGEIDLVVRRGRLVAFVEVKARPTFEAALDAVSETSARRIAAAAEWWIVKHPVYADYDQRFDFVLVVPGRWPKHVADAFRPRA